MHDQLETYALNFENETNWHIKDKGTLGISFLKKVYSRLKRNYNWFRKTQKGDISQWGHPVKDDGNLEAYRWRGRTDQHTLTSGSQYII